MLVGIHFGKRKGAGGTSAPVEKTHIHFLLLLLLTLGHEQNRTAQAAGQNQCDGHEYQRLGAGFGKLIGTYIYDGQINGVLLIVGQPAFIGGIRKQLETIGCGSFGQTVKAFRMQTGEFYQTGFIRDEAAICEALAGAGAFFRITGVGLNNG